MSGLAAILFVLALIWSISWAIKTFTYWLWYEDKVIQTINEHTSSKYLTRDQVTIINPE